MKAMIGRAIKDRRWSLLAYCAGGLLLILMYSSLFPSIKDQSAAFQQAFKGLPEGVSKAFGISDSIYTQFSSYLGVEMFSITWPLIALIMVISWAGNAIAGEAERRTLGLVLSAPLSRTSIYWAKYLAGLIAFGNFVVVSLLSIFPIAAAFNISVNAWSLEKLIILAGLFGWAAYAIAMLLSAVFSERGKVYGLMAVVYLLMYVANVVANLKDNLGWVKYVSFFYYFKYVDVLHGDSLSALSLAVYLTTIAACSILGWQIFKRKDLAI